MIKDVEIKYFHLIFYKGSSDEPCVPSSAGERKRAGEPGAPKGSKKTTKKSKTKSKKSGEKSAEKTVESSTVTENMETPMETENKETSKVVIGTVKQSVLVTTESIGKEAKAFDSFECTLPIRVIT